MQTKCNEPTFTLITKLVMRTEETVNTKSTCLAQCISLHCPLIRVLSIVHTSPESSDGDKRLTRPLSLHLPHPSNPHLVLIHTTIKTTFRVQHQKRMQTKPSPSPLSLHVLYQWGEHRREKDTIGTGRGRNNLQGNKTVTVYEGVRSRYGYSG